jgi:isopentenyl-diphosphate Delta-isomerase
MEHIRFALETGQDRTTGFDDLKFIHQSIPNSSVKNVRLDCKMSELSLSSPIFINAMTGGGGEETLRVNRDLAIAARDTGLTIAVGSQMSALKEPLERKTYEIVRKENPKGVIIANLGSEATIDQARAAIEMVDANALQLHLNVIQELTMPEGDRDFKGTIKRIEAIANGIDIPIIVKEVGFGMSHETVSILTEVGVSAVDVGGYGGTNFARIENRRRKQAMPFFNDWGIPTAISIIEASTYSNELKVIGSGGVQSGLDIAKSIAVGAHAVGMAGFFLRILMEEGLEELVVKINDLHEELTYIMVALGTPTISDLRGAPIMISGQTFHWLNQRGIDTKKYCQR